MPECFTRLLSAFRPCQYPAPSPASATPHCHCTPVFGGAAAAAKRHGARSHPPLHSLTPFTNRLRPVCDDCRLPPRLVPALLLIGAAYTYISMAALHYCQASSIYTAHLLSSSACGRHPGVTHPLGASPPRPPASPAIEQQQGGGPRFAPIAACRGLVERTAQWHPQYTCGVQPGAPHHAPCAPPRAPAPAPAGLSPGSGSARAVWPARHAQHSVGRGTGRVRVRGKQAGNTRVRSCQASRRLPAAPPLRSAQPRIPPAPAMQAPSDAP